MDVSLRDAAIGRLRFIRSEMHRLMEEIDTFSEYDAITATVADIFFGDQFRELAEEQAAIVKPMKHPAKVGSITDEQIKQAKAVPVASLVQFTKGRALAWCHEDHSPSLYIAPRVNRVVCPVCNRNFDSIGILMNRDGMSFLPAVRQLAA